MKLTIKREPFLAAFGKVAQVVPNRASLEAWAKVRMECGSDGCLIHANGGELAISCKPEGVTVREPGSCLLPPKEFVAILRESRVDELHIDEKVAKIVITSGRDKFTILAQPDKGEFGKPPAFPRDQLVVLDGSHFADALKAALIAAGDGGKWAYNSVCVSLRGGYIYCVGMDGGIVNRGAVPVSSIIREPLAQWPLLSVRGARQVASIAELGHSLIAADASKFYFEQGAYTLSSALVEGRYRDWVKTVGQVEAAMADSPTCEIPAEEFRRAVRRAKISCGEDTLGIDLSFTVGMLTMAAAGQGGDSEVKLPVSFMDDDISLRLHSERLLAAISLIEDEEVLTIRLKDDKHPVWFSTASGFLSLVMPLETDKPEGRVQA